jgi:hypothetical protein
MLAEQEWSTGACVSSSGKDPWRVITTGSFRVIQFNSSQKPFVAFGYVPKAGART